MELIYLTLTILFGVVCGVFHNLILLRHVLPYMKRRGHEMQGKRAPFQLGKILHEYYKIDDPQEKHIKLLLRCTNVPFFLATGIVGFVIIYSAIKANA